MKFQTGNTWSALGGKARADKLTPERRREIAKAGFRGLCEKRFGGHRRKCAAWLFDPLGMKGA